MQKRNKTLIEFFESKGYCLCDSTKIELSNIENKIHDRVKLNNLKPLLANMVKYSTRQNWIDLILNGKFGKDSSSLERFIYFFGEESGTILFNKKLEKSTIFGPNSKKQNNINTFIMKYGPTDGPVKYRTYLSNWVSSMKKSRKEKNWTYCPNNFEHILKKYGESRAEKIYKERIDSAKKRTSKEEFLKTHTLEEWNAKVDFLAKLAYSNSNKSRKYFSKISQELFSKLLEYIDDKVSVNFATNNGEKRFWVDKDTIKYISADFAYHNKIIEFDGNYWHSRPGVSERDKIKDNILISMGYEVLRVKEGDWISSPLTTLKKCLEFLCIKI